MNLNKKLCENIVLLIRNLKKCVFILLILFNTLRAYSQGNKTINYINNHKPSMHECFYTFLPEVYNLANFLQNTLPDTLVMRYNPTPNQLGTIMFRFFDSTMINMLDTQMVLIYKNGLLRETWDFKLRKSNFDSIYEENVFIKNIYSYYPRKNELVIKIASFNKKTSSRYLTLIKYKDDLLTEVKLSKINHPLKLNFNFTYLKEFLDTFKSDTSNDIMVFPFDTITLNSSLTRNKKCKIGQCYFSDNDYLFHQGGNIAQYQYGRKYNDCFYDSVNLFEEFFFANKTLSDLSIFFKHLQSDEHFIINLIEKRKGVLESKNDCYCF